MGVNLRVILISLLITGVATSEDVSHRAEPTRPTKGQFVRHTFGPRAVGWAAAGAAIGQARNSPHEWGQGVAGFGKRFGSAFASHVVKNGIKFPVAYILHEDLSYHPSGKNGFMPRLAYALESTVITRKTNT